MAFTENLPAFFLDFGVQVTAGGFSALAIFDAPDEDVLGGRQQTTQYSITFPAGALGPLVYLSAVTVSGTPDAQFDGAYRLRANPVQIEDGRLQRANLEVAA